MSFLASVFEEEERKVFRFEYEVTLLVDRIAGGVPNNDRVVEGWLRKKLGMDDTKALQEAVAKVMVERTEKGENITKDEAVDQVIAESNINGFKKDPVTGIKYIEGRQFKAMLKEAVSVAVGAGNLKATGWGETKKWITNFFPEHCFVDEDQLFLGQLSDERDPNSKVIPVREVTGVSQRFVQTRLGSSISYEEYVDGAVVQATLKCDYEFKDTAWATIWLTGQQQGLGASRSQGFGRFKVIRWEKTRNEPKPVAAELLDGEAPKAPRKTAAKKAVPAAV